MNLSLLSLSRILTLGWIRERGKHACTSITQRCAYVRETTQRSCSSRWWSSSHGHIFYCFFLLYILSHPHSRCRARTLKKDNRGEVSYFLWLPLLVQVRRVDVGEQWLDQGTDCLTAVTCARVCVFVWVDVQVTRTNSSDRDEERREREKLNEL